MLVAQWCLTLCNPWTVCIPPYYWIQNTRILEWVAISFSRGSYRPMDRTNVSCPSRWVLYCLSHRNDELTLVACFSHGFICNVLFLWLHWYNLPWSPSPLTFWCPPSLSSAGAPSSAQLSKFSLCPLSVLFFLSPSVISTTTGAWVTAQISPFVHSILLCFSCWPDVSFGHLKGT